VAWLTIKVLIAVGAALAFYLAGAAVVRGFMRVPPAEPDVRLLRSVNYRYRCTVCGTEVTMTATPEGDVPDAPRHCREDMSLVVEGGEW
jgi:hypothetical protein